MHSASLLHDLGLCIVSATACAFVARAAGQPLLLAYVGAGVAIGPIGLGLISDHKAIEHLAELGLAFLLFIVGLEMDLAKLAASGRLAMIATVVQVLGSWLLAFAAALAMGFPQLPAAYIGAAAAFSSTMVVVKLLSDRSELDTLPGRTTLAVLLVQDALAIVVLAIQPNLGGSAEGSFLASLGGSLVKGVGLVGAIVLASRTVLPWLLRTAQMLPELLVATAISWCFVVCGATMAAGFSSAMGALIAGVAIANLPYSVAIIAKVLPLRDFFVTLFLVSLGMLLEVPTKALLAQTAVLTVVVMASRIGTLLPVLKLFGMDTRVGFLSSIHLAQVSEFAVVIVLLGSKPEHKHIGSDVVSVVLMTLVVTSVLSTYLIQYSHRLAAWVVPRVGEGDEESEDEIEAHDQGGIVLVGCHRAGATLVEDLRKSGRRFSVIDFSPRVHEELRKRDVRCVYGDIGHMDTLEHAGVHHAKVVVSSISDDFLRGTDNLKLLKTIRKINPHAFVIVAAESLARARELYREGADYVVLPRLQCASKILQVIDRLEVGEFEAMKASELGELDARQDVVP